MADTSPPSVDVKSHEKGYSKFINVFKWGAIIAFALTAFIVFLIA